MAFSVLLIPWSTHSLAWCGFKLIEYKDCALCVALLAGGQLPLAIGSIAATETLVTTTVLSNGQTE